ncbi:MAG: hypothetical protein AAGB00_12910 [Planctomycetota bacterium]
MSTSPPRQSDDRPRLPAAVQQRLHQVFLHAGKSFEKGDHDYAHDLYTQCVSEDPSALAYAQHFRANLTKRAGAGRKASAFGGLLSKSGRGAVEKPAAKGAWQDAFAAGCQALQKNPGDIGVLQAMAAAAGELGHADCQLYYLRWALDINGADVETNRMAGFALAGVGEFDQAIACWRRVLQNKPNDEEASKQVSRLSVEKTIHVGGYKADVQAEDGGAAAISTARVADLAATESDGAPRLPTPEGAESAPTEDFEQAEKRLLAAIDAQPTVLGNYPELAEHYPNAARLKDADRLLQQAHAAAEQVSPVAAAGVQEKLEDVRLRRVRQQVEVARSRVASNDNEETRKLLTKVVEQASRAELAVYAARADRSPGDSRLHFEIGIRHKRLGEYREAIKAFQAARGDSSRLAETQIFLGECFQHIEQYKLAMSSYEAAIEQTETTVAGAAKEDVRKLCLYRAGVLAMGMRDYDRAEQRLTELAALDFSYRDVAGRLDKVAAMRKDT